VRHILNRGRRAPETLSRRLRQGEADHICILVDQFEELFSFAQRRGPEDARLFVEFLVGLEENPPPRLYAILTMRSEFLGHCARFEGLAGAVNRTQYLLPRMERPALLRAIRQPATLYGGEVSQELAERMIADAGGGQDQLPLIQHGLMRLWRRKRQQPRGLAEAAVSYQHDGLAESPARYEIDEAPLSFRRDDARLASWSRGLSRCGEPRRSLVGPRRRGDGAGCPGSRTTEDRRAPVPGPDRHQRRGPRDPASADLCRAGGGDRQRCADARGDHRPLSRQGIWFLTPYGDASIQPDTLIDISHEALIRCWRKIADKEEGWLQREFRDGLIWKTLRMQAQRGETLAAAATTSRDEWLETLPSPAWTERYGGGWKDVQQLMARSRTAREEEVQRQRDYVRAAGADCGRAAAASRGRAKKSD
jgi:hypothetical protein